LNAQLQPAANSRHAIKALAAVKGSHIPSLDGIRALAAVWVFAGHAGMGHVLPGAFGVTIFFFLSGYLITTLLRIEHEATGGISLKKFYLRRAYRILPPMYIVLGLAVLLCLIGVLPGHMTLGAVAAQVGHLTNYYVIRRDGYGNIVPTTGILWSLAVEEHFYLFYPIALALLLKRYAFREIAAILACTCLAVLLWRCYLIVGMHVTETYTYVATDARLDSLLYGCILGVWLNPSLDPPTKTEPWVWCVILGLAALLLLVSFRAQGKFSWAFVYSLQGIALFPIFCCAIRYSEWPLFRWLNFRWVRTLGLISYTFYLSHVSALHISRRLFPNHLYWTALIAFAVTLAFAAAMYFFVERYFAVLRHRLHR
jgi:peptidoglycan/LPS O-acetylase OafA/YrhL